MRPLQKLTDRPTLWKMSVALSLGMSFLTPLILAQNAGSPAVEKVTVSGGTVTVVPAYPNAYIDASASSLVNSDFCVTLQNALKQLNNGTGSGGSYVGGAAVIDMRGVPPTPSTSNFPCGTSSSNSINPWLKSTTPTYYTAPSTVLLPAGTIKTYNTWTLPSGTRLIGQGGEDPGAAGTTPRTTIQAQSGFATGTIGQPVIQMGTAKSTPCTAVSIEDLVIDGAPNGGSVNGIDDLNCQDQSYVNHVTIYRVNDIGLNVYNSNDPAPASVPANSGPFTNITYDTGGLSTTQTDTFGVYLNQATRGIQGLTCTTGSSNPSTTSVPGTCVYVGAPGNSVQDVRVEGVDTGVEVAAGNTVVMNVDGDTIPALSTTTTNVVTIDGGKTNVVLMGISNNCYPTTTCTTGNQWTINDVATGTKLGVAKDPFVAMYVLGSSLASQSGSVASYSRYTTSQSTQSWSVGSGNPSGTCVPGSLYSNTTSGGSGTALWVCSAFGTTTKNTWTKVK